MSAEHRRADRQRAAQSRCPSPSRGLLARRAASSHTRADGKCPGHRGGSEHHRQDGGTPKSQASDRQRYRKRRKCEPRREKRIRTHPDDRPYRVASDDAVGRARWANRPGSEQVRRRAETRNKKRMTTHPCNRAADSDEHAPDDGSRQALGTGYWRVGHTLDPRICR